MTTRTLATASALGREYQAKLSKALDGADWEAVDDLAAAIRQCWADGKQVFICGNGGSAANAMHMANDLLYGVAKDQGKGLRVNALPSNASVLTCLANDCGYDSIYAIQLDVHGGEGDVLIVLSGSGNSPNVLNAISVAKKRGMRSYAILGYSGGKAKAMADRAIHFAVDDMQISEDLQLVVGHVLMQWLHANPPAAA